MSMGEARMEAAASTGDAPAPAPDMAASSAQIPGNPESKTLG